MPGFGGRVANRHHQPTHKSHRQDRPARTAVTKRTAQHVGDRRKDHLRDSLAAAW